MQEMRSMTIAEDKPAFEDFMGVYGNTGRVRFRMISEGHRYLFTIPREHYLARCVAADLDTKKRITLVNDQRREQF